MRSKKRSNKFFNLLFAALAVAAIAQELQKPAPIRRWTGTLLDFIPYDFRVPTLARFKASVWSPDDERLLLPTAFGVGWSINIGRIVKLVKGG